MSEGEQEPRLFSGDLKPGGSTYPQSFELFRAIAAAVLGGLGGVTGLLFGFFGTGFLDMALGHPWGSSGDLISIGNLTAFGTALGPLVGAWVGAVAGHRFLGGPGGIWPGLVATLLGVGALVAISVWHTAIYYPALLVPPITAALGLELSAWFQKSANEGG
jgi:hypothetical protein